MGCELATPPTLPTSSAGGGSLTGLVDSGEYLAPQSYRGHGVGNVRDSSGSTHEGPIHDDMIDKILTVLPRGNIYQPPLVPGDDTETLSFHEWRGKSTCPSGPLKVHNWPNPVNSMDSKRIVNLYSFLVNQLLTWVRVVNIVLIGRLDLEKEDIVGIETETPVLWQGVTFQPMIARIRKGGMLVNVHHLL